MKNANAQKAIQLINTLVAEGKIQMSDFIDQIAILNEVVEIETQSFSNAIRIEEIQDKIYVYSYANPMAISKMKNLRGVWNSSKGAWVLDASQKQNAANALLEVFGVDGLSAYPTCKIQVQVQDSETGAPVVVFSRPICRAFSRDSGAKLCEGIYMIEGKINSCGSAKYWGVKAEGIFEIHDFPIAMLERENVKKDIEKGETKIL